MTGARLLATFLAYARASEESATATFAHLSGEATKEQMEAANASQIAAAAAHVAAIEGLVGGGVEWGFVHRDGSTSTTVDEAQARSMAGGLGYMVTGAVVRRTVSQWEQDL